MRSLVVTPTPTHPTNQGNRARVHQIASALRRVGAVEVLYYALDGLDERIVEAMREAWDMVHIVPAGGFRAQSRRPSHWGIDEWVSPQLMQAVRFLAAATDYDVVVVNYVWCSWVLTAFDAAATLRVLDTHDAFGDRHQVTRAAGLPAHWFYTTREEEAVGLDRADVVLAIQPEEGRAFTAMTTARVEVIEYAPTPSFLRWREMQPPLAVGYLGSGNPWNVETLRDFDALLARRAIPSGLFLALGGVTRKAAGLQVFQPGGEIDAVADAYAVLDIVVNPMQGGTGLKIKTVEALAHGRVVLSTRDGGLGLEAIHPDLLHADAGALADRLLHLLAHPEQLPELAAAMQAGYRAFHAGLDARLRALVDEWADASVGKGR